jgi:hypothetical protein
MNSSDQRFGLNRILLRYELGSRFGFGFWQVGSDPVRRVHARRAVLNRAGGKADQSGRLQGW